MWPAEVLLVVPFQGSAKINEASAKTCEISRLTDFCRENFYFLSKYCCFFVVCHQSFEILNLDSLREFSFRKDKRKLCQILHKF
jgi:hypothetical protein